MARARRTSDMSPLAPPATYRSQKNITHLAGHIEGGQKRGKDPQVEWPGRNPAVRGMQNLLLAPKPGEQQRKAAQSEHPDAVSSKGHRHELAQSTHPAYVLFIPATVNYRTRAQKQKRLEKRVSNEVKHPDRHATCAQAQHHEAQL